MKNDFVYLIYDKQCPLCDNYYRMTSIKEAVGELVLVNAREESGIMAEITNAGLDIDKGMVLKIQDDLFYGSHAMHVLSLISSKKRYFNKINHWFFRSKHFSNIAYPILRSLRNALLKILKKEKINNLRKIR